MMNLTKAQLEDKIRLLYHKHRGNVAAVAAEAELDDKYVQSICRKIKKKMSIDVNERIAGTLMQHMFEGNAQRLYHINKTLEQMENIAITVVSSCCKANIETIEADGKMYYVCTKCQDNCVPITKTDKSAYGMMMTAVDALRKEDELLIKFAEKMGYIATGEKVVPQKINQNIIVMNQNNPALDAGTQETLNDIAQMTATDRAELLQNLQKEVLDVAEEGKFE